MPKDVLLFTDNYAAARKELEECGGYVTHKFTDAAIVAKLPDDLDTASLKNAGTRRPSNLDSDSQLMADAWNAGQAELLQKKGPDATEGLSWDTPGYEPPGPVTEVIDPATLSPDISPKDLDESLQAVGWPYMVNSVAVGVVVVSGTGSGLNISDSEYQKIFQEVQKGLDFYVTSKPSANLTFVYDLRRITVSAAPCNTGDCTPINYDVCEAPWRDPALGQMGYSPDWSGVNQYVADLKTSKGTQWSYAAFFTKYPLCHFAYASLGGPRLVMNYYNDGWGVDNIHRVFAHESGHIFSAPDEYKASNCSCSGAYGNLGVPNYNCANCPGAHVSCLMDANTLELCDYSQWQIGWNNRLLVNECIGTSGGTGGAYFEERPLPAGARINKIRVRHGTRIDAIGISYELGGTTTDLPMHGGGGGTPSEFKLDADEDVTAIYGRYGARLDSLVIQTNKRTSIPYGGEGGEVYYQYHVTQGLKFAGFAGRSGTEVDAMGWILTAKGTTTPGQTFISMGPSGGTGGDDFTDPPIPAGARIVKVRVRHGTRIDAVGLSYELNGTVVDMPMHGGGGGTLSEFAIASDDYIVGISGTYGAKIDSLIIQTRNRQYSVRFGGSGGSAGYSYILSPDIEIVGFLGRSGAEVDAIGAVFRQRP
jgi:hypothetical protein